MTQPRLSLSPMAATKLRLTGMRKLIASVDLLRLNETRPDPIRMTRDERLRFWAAARMASRPI